jgi:hypothetical protein
MKSKWLLVVKYLLLSGYKRGLQDQGTDSFIAGIYEREHQYGSFLTRDILTIRCLSQITSLFQVERKTIRGLCEEGEMTDQLCKTEKWIASYHLGTHQLVQGISHKICSFVPERGMLMFENKEYQKTAKLAFDLSICQ